MCFFPMEIAVGVQDGLPENVPQWNIDYFKLKLLKKWSTQDGHPPSLLSS